MRMPPMIVELFARKVWIRLQAREYGDHEEAEIVKLSAGRELRLPLRANDSI
jgi:hypothetical protein